ncbi:hypothetical protein EVAR_3988_1 [Eumeta japonica]|uniref:Uncharacterized protein n=1 Tax=Eumeta variegata TaxID=151549 RepID=A0A4C1STU7_EUMVA|nr:hypothetical protein EVAR_3988_1 [Eumeta japonica]
MSNSGLCIGATPRSLMNCAHAGAKPDGVKIALSLISPLALLLRERDSKAERRAARRAIIQPAAIRPNNATSVEIARACQLSCKHRRIFIK